MNKQGVGPSLTISIIAVAAFVMAIILIQNFSNGFYNDNALIINTGYNNVYTNINNTGTADLNRVTNTLNANGSSIVSTAISGIGTSLNAFAIGLGAINTLISLPTTVMSILLLVTEQMPAVGALLWFMTFAISIYLLMKVVQALRGTINEA
jgi:hypothetical protein